MSKIDSPGRPVAGRAMMSNPFTSASNVQIRLIRKNQPKSYNDDRIAISYNDYTDLYDLYYMDCSNVCGKRDCKKTRAYHVELDSDQLDTYLESLFFLLRRDVDPFENIQFEIPCFPVVLFEVQSLSKPAIRDTVKDLMAILIGAAKI